MTTVARASASTPDATVAPTHAERLREIAAPGWIDGVFAMLGAREPRLLIGDEWVPARSGRALGTFDPSTTDTIGTVAVAGEADVDHAVRTAKAAQPAWAALTMAERAHYIMRLGNRLAEQANLLAAVDSINAGLPVARMLRDIDNITNACRAWPGLALSLRGQVLEGTPGLHYTRYHPYGVVARIVAFNHPILFAVKGSLAALLAGNTVVVKPADQTPMSALVLGDIVREVLPPGVFNVVTGDAATGASLVTHPLIRRVAFTGSVPVGRRIQESAAKDRIRNVSLELGGKNAMLVFPDVAIDAAARSVVSGMSMWANGGQSCGSTSRIFVHQEIYEDFLAKLDSLLSGATLGPAYRTDVDMGPVISSQAADRIRDYIRSGTEQGGHLVTGGLDDNRVPARGHFVAPTVFRDVPPRARIATEEIFGPVISTMPWQDYESTIQAINDSDLGLTASVWTNDITRALTTADRLETGYVWINESAGHYFGTPFGGWKDSGVGREECIDELWSYLQLKSVHVKLP